MSKSQAKEFVEKFYSDDTFMSEVIEKGEIYKKDKEYGELPDSEQYRLFTDAAEKVGYKITPSEFETASQEYLEGLGKIKAIKSIAHMAKNIRKAKKNHA